MGTDQLRGVLESAGLRIANVELSYPDGAQVLRVAGWRKDGSIFNQTTTPFSGDPVERAKVLAAMQSGNASPIVDPLTLDLARGTERIAAAIPIAKAIISGRKAMGLAEKMGMLAERMQSVPKALEARADALLPRLDALESKGHPVFDGLYQVLADAEKGVAAAEDAMRQLGNFPLAGSKS